MNALRKLSAADVELALVDVEAAFDALTDRRVARGPSDLTRAERPGNKEESP